MDEASAKAILDEHVGPMLATDEGKGIMQAQQRQGEVLVSWKSFFICFCFSFCLLFAMGVKVILFEEDK